MAVKLMNSAMMPVAGLTYHPRRITAEDFGRLVAEAAARGELESYIGYEATAAQIARVSGVVPLINRAETSVEAGDVMLVCKLRYRPGDPRMKGSAQAQAALGEDDFEYWQVIVQE